MQPPETRQSAQTATGGTGPQGTTDPGVWIHLPDLAPSTNREPSAHRISIDAQARQAPAISPAPLPADSGRLAEAHSSDTSVDTPADSPSVAVSEQESFLAPELPEQETYYSADYSKTLPASSSTDSQNQTRESWSDDSTNSPFSPLPFPAPDVLASAGDEAAEETQLAAEAQLIEAQLIDESNDIAIFLDLERQSTQSQITPRQSTQRQSTPRQNTQRGSSAAQANWNTYNTLAADPSSGFNVAEVENESPETISFPMPEATSSVGLTGWLARLAPVMILLALIGAATLLLWFLLSGSPSPTYEQDSIDRNNSIGSNHSGSNPEGPSVTASIGAGSSDNLGANSEAGGQIDSNSTETKTDGAPMLGSPDGNQQFDLTIQSAWPARSLTPHSPGNSYGPSTVPNRPVMAEFTGAVEPLERVARQPAVERQAKTNSSIPSRQ